MDAYRNNVIRVRPIPCLLVMVVFCWHFCMYACERSKVEGHGEARERLRVFWYNWSSMPGSHDGTCLPGPALSSQRCRALEHFWAYRSQDWLWVLLTAHIQFWKFSTLSVGRRTARAQMRVMLNASALLGVILFSVFNVMGMNLGHAPDRLAGALGFAGSPFLGLPLFMTVRPLTPCFSLKLHCSLLDKAWLVRSSGGKTPEAWQCLLGWSAAWSKALTKCCACGSRAGHAGHLRAGCRGILCFPAVPAPGQAGTLQHYPVTAVLGRVHGTRTGYDVVSVVCCAWVSVLT